MLLFLAEAMTPEAAEFIMRGMAAIACAIAVFTGFSQGIGEAYVAAKAVEAATVEATAAEAPVKEAAAKAPAKKPAAKKTTAKKAPAKKAAEVKNSGIVSVGTEMPTYLL